MNALKKVGEILSKVMGSMFNHGGGASPQQSNDIDPSEYIFDLKKKSDQIEGSFDDHEEFEKAVCKTMGKCLMVAALGPGATVAEKFASSVPILKEQMPEILESSGLSKLVSDYGFKNDAGNENKISSVVSRYSNVDMQLGGAASIFSSEMMGFLKNSVPQTPLQKSGLLPDSEEIEKSLDRSMEYAKNNDRGMNNGPSQP